MLPVTDHSCLNNLTKSSLLELKNILGSIQGLFLRLLFLVKRFVNIPPVTNQRMLLSSCVLYIFNLDLIINQLCASAFKKANVDTLSLDNLVSSTESII